jgi:hypothetical protein
MNKLIEKLVEQAGIETEQDQAGNTFLKGWPEDLDKFAELIVAEAFRAGMLYSAKKYAAVGEDRFTGNDVVLFLEMEAGELTDDEIKEHFGVEE